jgi:hypothetical protein
MEQPVDPSEVDEDTEVRDIFDDAFSPLSDLDFGHNSFFAASSFLLDKFSSGYDDVPAFHVNFENYTLDLFSDESADIAGSSDVNLRSGQKDGHTDVNEQAALDASDDPAGDDIALLFRIYDVLPASDAVGFAFAQKDKSALGIGILEEDFDFSARLYFRRLLKFAGIDDAFAFETYFDDNVIAYLGYYVTFENGPRQAGIDLCLQDLLEKFTVLFGEHFTDLFVEFFL